MKRLILSAAALAALALPQVAFSKATDAGSAGTRLASQRQNAPAAPNFSATASGTAVSCGSGCTQISGSWGTNGTSAGTFTGRLTETSPGAACSGVSGTVNLMTGNDSLLLGVVGTRCGASFSGSYDVGDGTGAYQENGVGWGEFHFATAPSGAFTASSRGTFYAHTARQTGIGMGG